MYVALFKFITWLYIVGGAVGVAASVYTMFDGGFLDNVLASVMLMLIGLGLLSRRDPFRRVVLILSGMGMFVALDMLIVCIQVDEPVPAFALLGLGLAFPVVQLWVLTRTTVVAMFKQHER